MKPVTCAICGKITDSAVFTSTSNDPQHPKGWLCTSCYHNQQADYND